MGVYTHVRVVLALVCVMRTRACDIDVLVYARVYVLCVWAGAYARLYVIACVQQTR